MGGSSVFICPKCRAALKGFAPEMCECGYVVPQVDAVLQFCDDPPISLKHNGRRYLGYEHVGENYDGPKSSDPGDNGDYGIYDGCSAYLVHLLGRGSVVLDLGAGLGPASITLARAGANTVGADISQKMLSVAAKRASKEQLDGNLLFARMNAYNLPISDDSVDAVVAIDVLHQLDNPEVAIKEILRVLKPAGVFVEFSSRGLPLTPEQSEINRRCREALSDIRNYYSETLAACGYDGPPFSSWEKVAYCIAEYFMPPEVVQTQYDGVWTGAMAKGVHKLRTRASGSAQLIPDDIHDVAWNKTHAYAVSKYGANYAELPGYSRYSGLVKVYRIRSQADVPAERPGITGSSQTSEVGTCRYALTELLPGLPSLHTWVRNGGRSDARRLYCHYSNARSSIAKCCANGKDWRRDIYE
jgi:ubiquinone/menaquinone biosynthesis C-methylase UbiE